MKFLIDEDVAIEIAQSLRNQGHEVSLVKDVLGARTIDSDIWQHATRAETVVITCNRNDFLNLAGEDFQTGLIILNRQRTRQKECRNVLRLLANAGESGLQKNINFA